MKSLFSAVRDREAATQSHGKGRVFKGLVQKIGFSSLAMSQARNDLNRTGMKREAIHGV